MGVALGLGVGAPTLYVGCNVGVLDGFALGATEGCGVGIFSPNTGEFVGFAVGR